MNLIITLIVGAIIGWIAGRIMRTPGGLLVDLAVGMLGALIASLIFGSQTILSGNFSLPSLLWSLLGAVVLSAIIKLFTRGRM
ncbi:MAG: GlsB/YeaQ/YmgE family stress response membrane protein [Anaerolineae bacterium]